MPIARFCSACGAALPTRPPVTCAGCGTPHWLNAKPCANAIVADRGRLLLTRRARAPWLGMWCAPGGFCEESEHPIETVEREVAEETGLQVRVTGFIGIWLTAYSDVPHRDGGTIAVAYYHAEPSGPTSGEVDPAEVAELGWFAWDELPEGLAPPDTLPAVLAAWRKDLLANRTRTPLPDRPQR
jgi:8-oxo-dGTP diphosphatase